MWLLQTLWWWLLIELIGLLAAPMAVRLLRFLPDKGLGMRRALGLLASAFLFWLLVTLGLLYNTRAGAAFAVGLMGVLSFLFYHRGLTWLAAARERRRYLLIETGLFGAALIAWSFFRAHNPEIAATEKPMEFGFLNGILRSPTFPPRDPWLAGYGISYYYFGYIIAALLTHLSGLPSAVTFNLTGTLLFALTLSGSFSLVYNLVCAASQAHGSQPSPRSALWVGALGSVFVGVMGNLEGVLELVRAQGLGSEAFWAWWDIRNLSASPPSATWYPQDTWWWWRASRIIHDRDLFGNSLEVISEFPFFSFLLGDNHPHVLALPFVLLALALALNGLLGGRKGAERLSIEEEISSPLDVALAPYLGGLWPGAEGDLLLWMLFLGGLSFLNTWDFPIYLGLFVLAYGIGQYQGGLALRAVLERSFRLGVLLLGGGILLYAPFYLGLRSQAGGIGMVPFYIKTPWQQFLLMFGTQIVMILGFLRVLALKMRRVRLAWPLTARVWLAGLALLGAALAAIGWYSAALCMVLLGIVGGLLRRGLVSRSAEGGAISSSALFALLMVMVGLGLIVSVEFIYLKDVFATRMNTVFKFYYQGWVLLSLGAAYGIWEMFHPWRDTALIARVATVAWGVLGALLILGGLGYTVPAVVSKANAFQGRPTLDGVRYVAEQRPLEYEAILWLQKNARPNAIMVEASGGSYTLYNWISAHTGIPTLLGWGGHELQWHGSYQVPGEREAALATIYQSHSDEETLALLKRYGVDYLILGPWERQKYAVDYGVEAKFERLMARVFENEAFIIYARTW